MEVIIAYLRYYPHNSCGRTEEKHFGRQDTEADGAIQWSNIYQLTMVWKTLKSFCTSIFMSNQTDFYSPSNLVKWTLAAQYLSCKHIIWTQLPTSWTLSITVFNRTMDNVLNVNSCNKSYTIVTDFQILHHYFPIWTQPQTETTNFWPLDRIRTDKRFPSLAMQDPSYNAAKCPAPKCETASTFALLPNLDSKSLAKWSGKRQPPFVTTSRLEKLQDWILNGWCWQTMHKSHRINSLEN
jgi:hypothetical protein